MILYSHFYAEIEKQMVSNHVLPTPPPKKKAVICAIYGESNSSEVLEITVLILGYMYQVQIF